MVPEFETAAFALKPGETSGPVKSPFGYHLIQTQEKKAESVIPLEDVAPQIEQKLQSDKQQEIVTKLTDKLKTKFPVKVNKDLLPKAPHGGMGMHGGHPPVTGKEAPATQPK